MVDHFDIFFIKQKTAYEMRISDWISDWFSSDLRNAPSALHRAAGASGAAAWARAAASAGAIIPIVRAAIAATAYPCSMIVSVNLVIRALPPASAAPVEIGRANVCTPVTNAHLVCRILHEYKHNMRKHIETS